jgi:hypothetical protein
MDGNKFFTVPTLQRWQHYKDRCPPWIKLHRDVFNDYKFSQLSDSSKGHLMLIWLLASQMDNRVPCDQKWIAQKIGATNKIDLDELQRAGFIEMIQDASATLADCQQSAMRETEREAEAYTKETEAEVCAEAKTASTPEPEIPVMFFPIIGKEKQFPIHQKDIDEWQETYLGVDVMQDVKKCRQWNIDNPKNRKTVNGIRKHISAWLGRTQDSSKGKSNNQGNRQLSPREEAAAARDREMERIEKGLADGSIDFGFDKGGDSPLTLPLPE